MSKTGIIYRIEFNEDPDIRYIGSTFNSLTYRWRDHKQAYKKWLEGKHCEIAIYPYFKEHGIEKFSITKIKEYECVDKRHLLAYEQLYINKFKCVNKCNPFRIKYLYEKQYRHLNKEVLAQKHREYRQENKEVIAQKHRDYYEENKEHLNQKQKEYYEENKEVINQKNRDYYEENK